MLAGGSGITPMFQVPKYKLFKYIALTQLFKLNYALVSKFTK